MRKKWLILAPLIAAAFIAIGGQVVLQLWNWLLPAIFGWRQITFWQAVGLLALCRILFGGGGFGGRGSHRYDFRRRMGGRWEPGAPEERQKFCRGMRPGPGGLDAPATDV